MVVRGRQVELLKLHVRFVLLETSRACMEAGQMVGIGQVMQLPVLVTR